MQWSPETEFNFMSVSAAPYGGPIALVRDSAQFTKVTTGTSKPIIRIFTASGNLISSFTVFFFKPIII